ncbi:MAG: hypothetical protein REJ24_10200 [Rhodocyclaceae bacterium]|nr:hypothetical protein [Rhodocyclaceae bacterium]
MHCQTSSCDTARLAPGQSLHIAVDAGTAFVVTAGRLRIDEAPRWIADVCVPVGRTLDEGAHHVVDRAGWVTLSALGAPVQWRRWAAPAPAPRNRWRAWAGARRSAGA